MKSAIALSAIVLVVVTYPAASHAQSAIPHREIDSLRAAIEDLRTSFGSRYPKADDYLQQLDAIVQSFNRGAATAGEQFSRLRQEALLANPLLEDLRLLLVKRNPNSPKRGWKPPPGLEIGMPSNHECNTSLNRRAYDNEIAVLQSVRPDGRLCHAVSPEARRLRGRNRPALGRPAVPVHAIGRGELEGLGDGRRRPRPAASFAAAGRRRLLRCLLPARRPDRLRLHGARSRRCPAGTACGASATCIG